VQVELRGRNTPDGEHISTAEQATAYLLNEAKLAIVPFYAFGSSRESNWYRLSVGTASMSDVSGAISKLREALLKLS
jgi:aspartate aminotransferase